MRHLYIVLMALFLVACMQKKTPIIGQTEFQKNINEEFKDASTSPLKGKDLKTFSGLVFFPFDTSFVVEATLHPTPDTTWFSMKTTTDRVSKERVYGILNFELKGKSFELKVYQGEDLMLKEGFEDYLFLPFIDNTNGSSTYGGGRYIDLRIPAGAVLDIDFNTAYNPYCAYNDKYSCPIVPRENYIDMEVTAGVKFFIK